MGGPGVSHPRTPVGYLGKDERRVGGIAPPESSADLYVNGPPGSDRARHDLPETNSRASPIGLCGMGKGQAACRAAFFKGSGCRRRVRVSHQTTWVLDRRHAKVPSSGHRRTEVKARAVTKID